VSLAAATKLFSRLSLFHWRVDHSSSLLIVPNAHPMYINVRIHRFSDPQNTAPSMQLQPTNSAMRLYFPFLIAVALCTNCFSHTCVPSSRLAAFCHRCVLCSLARLASILRYSVVSKQISSLAMLRISMQVFCQLFSPRQ
jgi:hypothetical protein